MGNLVMTTRIRRNGVKHYWCTSQWGRVMRITGWEVYGPMD
jgi:hypothetical protein